MKINDRLLQKFGTTDKAQLLTDFPFSLSKKTIPLQFFDEENVTTKKRIGEGKKQPPAMVTLGLEAELKNTSPPNPRVQNQN